MKSKMLAISVIMFVCSVLVTNVLAADPPRRKLTGSDKMRINGYANENKLRNDIPVYSDDEDDVVEFILSEIEPTLNENEFVITIIPVEETGEYEILIGNESLEIVDCLIY